MGVVLEVAGRLRVDYGRLVARDARRAGGLASFFNLAQWSNVLRGRPDGRGRRRRYPAQESLIVRRRSGARRSVRGALKSRLVAALLGRVRASRRRSRSSSAEPPSWSSPPQRCYGSTRGLIRGNLANGGLIWDVSCEWTPAGGFLRPRGLCGFDTPKRCQGLTRPESLDGQRALACAGFSCGR